VFTLYDHADFVTYNLDMSSDPNWTGTVSHLRFDPTQSSGAEFEFDYLRTYGPVQTGSPEWRWGIQGDTLGWTARKHLTSPVVTGGILSSSSTGTDPSLWSPVGLSVDAASRKWVVIRMRVSSGSFAEIYYRSPAEGFSAEKKRRFDLLSNTGFVTYQLDFSADPNWTGTIDRLRLDPTIQTNADVELDYVLVK